MNKFLTLIHLNLFPSATQGLNLMQKTKRQYLILNTKSPTTELAL